MTSLKLHNISESMQEAISRYLKEMGYQKNEINAVLLNADINQKPIDYLMFKCPRLFEDANIKSKINQNLN